MNSPGISPTETERLSNQAKLWSIAAVASFVLGASLIVGPLAWWQGASLRRQLRELGAADNPADLTVKLGVAVTVVHALAFLAIALVLLGIAHSASY